jgi:hypothetical protein
MAIDPISLPSAAGINYGEGDVRHFSEGDAVGVPGLSAPTRELAQRDSLLAAKLNEVVNDVNNKEQIVTLPVYRTVLPASAEEIVANFRIAPGYEARVLNAIISSTPVSANTQLNIMWANGFGNVTGQTVLTTTSEATGGTKFSPTGEFIIEVRNMGDTTLDVVASVILTMRPIAGVTSALLPAPSVAPAGPPGKQGPGGKKGDPGQVGPPGSAGLTFRNRWTAVPFPVTYNENDIVTHDFAGTSGVSTFVAVQSHIAADVNQPQPSLIPSPFWDFIAEAGATGATGTQGAAVFPTFSHNTLRTTATTSSNYVALPYNGDDNYSKRDLLLAGTTAQQILSWNEFAIQGGAQIPNGVAFLARDERRTFNGTIGFALPQPSNGASTSWQVGNVACIATVHGTINTLDVINVSGTFANTVRVVPDGSGTIYSVNVDSAVPQQVDILFSGVTSLSP